MYHQRMTVTCHSKLSAQTLGTRSDARNIVGILRLHHYRARIRVGRRGSSRINPKTRALARARARERKGALSVLRTRSAPPDERRPDTVRFLSFFFLYLFLPFSLLPSRRRKQRRREKRGHLSSRQCSLTAGALILPSCRGLLSLSFSPFRTHTLSLSLLYSLPPSLALSC